MIATSQRPADHEVTVRPVRPQDAADLVDVYDALGYPAPAREIAARLARIADDPSYRTWVAELDGTPVGLAGARCGWAYEDEQAHVQLLALAVTEAAQGAGVGAALVAVVERWARAQGAGRVVLHSGYHRDTAHRFYRALGFDDTGLRFVKPVDSPTSG